MNVRKSQGHTSCSSQIVLEHRVFFVPVEIMFLNAGISSIGANSSCRVTNFLLYVSLLIQPPPPPKKKKLKELGLDKYLTPVDHSELDTFS